MLVTLTVREVHRATPRAQIVRLDLGRHRFAYDAGQAVLIAPHGDPQRRPYSISAAPEDARREHALELLMGTEPSEPPAPHFVPSAGDRVDVEGPFGAFTFPKRPAERRFLFVAGGTGIAPLRAMLRHALAHEHAGIGLVYSARTPHEFAYAHEFHELAHAGRIEFRQTVTRATPAEWHGPHGRINRHLLEQVLHHADTLCFVCGPGPLVRDVPVLLEERGIARDRIRVDAYE